MTPRVPKASEFPPGTDFVIKEFDVPLVRVPGQGGVNWFGGVPRPYDVTFLKVDNNWPAPSFEEWADLVAGSIQFTAGISSYGCDSANWSLSRRRAILRPVPSIPGAMSSPADAALILPR